MSRSNYSDDYEHIHLYRQAVTRAIRGVRGQQFLLRLRGALDAMPVKRLIANFIVNNQGEVCALGAIDPTLDIDPEDRQAVAKHYGIAPALAAEIAYINDEWLLWRGKDETPEARWQRVRTWVDEQISACDEI